MRERVRDLVTVERTRVDLRGMGLDDVQATYFLFCEAVARDAGGKLSFIGIFDRIFAKTFPAPHPRIVVCVGLSGPQNESRNFRIALQNSQNVDVIPRMPEEGVSIAFSPHGTASAQFVLDGIPFTAPGIYSFKLFSQADDREITEQTLWVEGAPGQ